MSIDTLTPDEFMDLDSEHHELALMLYDERILLLQRDLRAADEQPEAAHLAAEWGRCLTLRKLHEQQLLELRAAGEPADAADTVSPVALPQ